MKGRLVVLVVVVSLGLPVPSWAQFGGGFFGGAPEAKQVYGGVNIVVKAHSPSSERGDTSFTNGSIPEIVRMDDLVFQFQIGDLGARNLKGALLKTPTGDVPIAIPKTGPIAGKIPAAGMALGHNMIVTYVDQKDGYVKIIPIPLVSEILPFRRGIKQTDYGMVVFVLVDPGRDVIDWAVVQKHSALKNFSADALYRLTYNGGTPVVGTVMRNLVMKAVEQIHNRPPVEETPPPADQGARPADTPAPAPLGDPTIEVHDEEDMYHLHVDWGKATAVRYRVSLPRRPGEWQEVKGEAGAKSEITVEKAPGAAILIEATIEGKQIELKKLEVPIPKVSATTERAGDDLIVHLENLAPYEGLVYRFLDDRGQERLKKELVMKGDTFNLTLPYRAGWIVEIGLRKPGEKEPGLYFNQKLEKEGKS